VDDLRPLLSIARDALLIRVPGQPRDRWLLEHAERVMELSRMIAQHPEAGADEVDQTAMLAAALFHDAGWVVQVNEGEVSPWQVLSRPTNDNQRELGATLLIESAEDVLPPETARKAADVIRQCNEPSPALVEAQIVAEAESLDDIGLLCVLRQFRQFQSEARPLEHLLTSWVRQREYGYWDARLQTGLRFEFTRRIARQRLDEVGRFMDAFRVHRTASDVQAVLESVSTSG